ncbi:glycosyltransferase [Mycobacterium kubicae]|uniref:glycosyltransferase family 2 protein n=1 Tax=Mycobacterium kubicae TaxID=120959 RepID=UPI001640662E|nr:glycosyltransferase [Mycobacterium kubicae]QNI06768.1 glycosyltransferase [Mycobacterium kubicae]
MNRPAQQGESRFVSVCVPTYNNGATIERCLRSILNQKNVDFEIVIVDDNSSDGCRDIAAAMLRAQDRLVCNTTRLGLNQNHNKCLKVARAELIQFVHGDDWLLPGALGTLASCFDDPAVGMAFAPRRVETEDNEFRRVYGVLHTHFRKLEAQNRGSSLVKQMVAHGALHNWIGEPTCVMFRRRLALNVGGFRDDVYQLVDLDIWYRLMLRSDVGFVPHELSVRTHTATTESARNLSMRRYWLDQLRILTWLTVDPASSAGVRTLAGLWWVPAWLSLLQAVLRGPERWWCLKTFGQAPFREFARARRFRGSLGEAR